MKYDMTLMFMDPILGSTPADPDLYVNYVAREALDNGIDVSHEMSAIKIAKKKIEENGDLDVKMTQFLRMEGASIPVMVNDPKSLGKNQPGLAGHVIRGFMKEAVYFNRQRDDIQSLCKGIAAYKQKIDGLVHVSPKLIPINMVGAITMRSDPLRAQTPKGERIAIAYREQIKKGASIQFTLTVLADKIFTEDVLREIFDYGQYMGIGQWRSSGEFGKFTYEMQRQS